MLSNNFRILHSPQLRIDTPQFGLVDFRSLSDARALEIWQIGFEFIGISADGAKKYFSKLNSSELVELIKTRLDPTDVILLAGIKKTKSVEKAKIARLIELSDD